MSHLRRTSLVRRWTALAAAAVLITTGVVLATAPATQARARALPHAPDPDLNSYVLFGFDELNFKGGQGSGGASDIEGGNIGVNATGLLQGNPRMNLCSNARMIMSDHTMVVSDTLRLGQANTPVQECDVYQVFANYQAHNNEESRTGPARPFTPPVLTATPPLPDFTCSAGNPVNISPNGTATLTPGSYGQWTFQGGSTVTLTSGTYSICGMNTGQRVTVITQPGVVLQVAGGFLPTDNLSFGPPGGRNAGCAGIPVVYARGDGISANANSVRFGQDSHVWGHFYAPSNQLNLGNQTRLHGTFWAREINSDFSVDVEYCNPRLPEPETGTLELTKKVTGAQAGLTPGAEFTVHLNCTIPGPGVRDALDGNVTLTAGQTTRFTHVQVGTTCTLREVHRTPPRPGFDWEPAEFVPSRTVTITADGETVEAVIKNPLRAVFGTIRVHKEVTGDTGGYVRGSRFGFALDCEDNQFDTTFSLAAGDTFVSEPVRVGVPCTVRETGVPPAARGFTYRAPVLTPGSGHVTIDHEDQTVTVHVTNRLVGSHPTGTGPIGPS